MLIIEPLNIRSGYGYFYQIVLIEPSVLWYEWFESTILIIKQTVKPIAAILKKET